MTVRRKPVLLTLFAVVMIALTGFLVWCSAFAPATASALDRVRQNPAIAYADTPAGVVLTPTADATGTGLLFVPGARVEASAYAWKLSSLVEAGVTVVIAKPVLNLAFFDLRPASAFTGLAPEVTDWYTGGHSLGGVKACQFAADPVIEGLVLFGSYCANDLSGSDLPVLSIAGSNDGLSSPQKIADAAGELPPDTSFVELDGVNHASFGDYGPQAGDGGTSLSSAEVETMLAALLARFVR